MPSQFIPNSTHYAGSAQPPGVIYPRVWNPLTHRVESNDPQFSGYNRFGVQNTPRGKPAAQTLPAIFSGVVGQQPIQPVVPAAPQVAPVAVGTNVVTPPTSGISSIKLPKSENVSRVTDTLYGDLTAFRNAQNKVIEDFRSRFPEWFKSQQQTTAQENAATQGLFTGEAQSRSDSNVANFLAAANEANRKSIADVQRLSSRSAIASDASGHSSARDRARFAAIADINARAARDAAVAKMQADQWLTQLQQQMAGARAQRERALMTDSLLPAQAQSQIFENILRQLAILTPIEQSNLMAGIVGPGGYVGDTFGQLQALKLQDLARMASERQAVDQSNFNWTNLITNLSRPAQQPTPVAVNNNNWYDTVGNRR